MTRKVEQPALFGGVDCLGESSKEVACNVDSCPGILIQYVKKTVWLYYKNNTLKLCGYITFAIFIFSSFQF